MKPDYLSCLKPFPRYLNNAWRDLNEERGFFGDGSHGESGIRTQANLIFTSALLISLPLSDSGLSESDRNLLLQRAKKGLNYLTSGHLTGAFTCADGKRWGGVWQSAWWTTRMALGAQLIFSELSIEQQQDLQRVVVYEADLQLSRLVPTGLAEDTKAEENAWDAEILATAMALYSDHAHYTQWLNKFKEFTVNTFSTAADLKNNRLVDGVPLCEQVYTVNLHSDHTLENHGAYHFCYVASPLHSIAWSFYALQKAQLNIPEALFHNVEAVWQRAKPTFLDNRFAYLSGKDWARYTYGLYFILPALIVLQHRYQDSDAAAMEQARFNALAQEQADNSDGSFFGLRFTQGHYWGQTAKYESDCYANIGLAFLLQRQLNPKVQATSDDLLQENLSTCHVSPECGIAYARNAKIFASFSWQTLTTTYPVVQFIPMGHDDMAEWQANNLLGKLVLTESVRAVGVKAMRALPSGFEIDGVLSYLNRKGQFVYEHHVYIRMDTQVNRMQIRSRFVAKRKLFVRRIEGLYLTIANDRFNGYQRQIFAPGVQQNLVFNPKRRLPLQNQTNLPARIVKKLLKEFGYGHQHHHISSNWLNIDNVLGVIDLKQQGFHIQQSPVRNVADGSLHFDVVHCPYQNKNGWFQADEVMLDSEFIILSGDAESTAQYAESIGFEK